jgi:hypothetical protein
MADTDTDTSRRCDGRQIVSVALDPVTVERLREEATANERRLSAHIRFIVTQHLVARA